MSNRESEQVLTEVAEQLGAMLKDAALIIAKSKELRGHYRRGDMIAFGNCVRALFVELDNLDAKQKGVKK